MADFFEVRMQKSKEVRMQKSNREYFCILTSYSSIKSANLLLYTH